MRLDPAAPVVIGGVGGSGTRVVAQLCQELGVRIGERLNQSLDNLWFTALCKRPAFLAQAELESPDACTAVLSLLTRASVEGLRGQLSGAEAELVSAARCDLERGVGGTGATLADLETLVGSSPPGGDHDRWGWKEPNSHVWLKHLGRRFARLRYIHVIRHGLDMAYSTNRGQLDSWGRRYGVLPPRDAADLPRALLRYWVEANRLAISVASAMLGPRFHCIRFEELCATPRAHVLALAGFLGCSPSADAIERLSRTPLAPASRGRWESNGVRAFPDSDVAAVKEFGFRV